MYKKERIVDIKALIRCVLEKWKGILIVALVAALLLGGLKGFDLYRTYKQGQTQVEAETVQEDASGASKAVEMQRIKKQLEQKNAYFTESIMGEIDPTKEGFASADVIVQVPSVSLEENGEAAAPAQDAAAEEAVAAEGTEGAEAAQAEANAEAVTEEAGETAANIAENNTADAEADQDYTMIQNRELSILNYYGTSAVHRTDLTEAAKQLGTTEDKLHELVSYKFGSNKNSMITVKVIYPDQEGAKVILDEVLEQLRAMKPQAEEQYGEHTLLIANELNATINDTSMYKWVYNRATEIVQLINSQKTLDKNLSSGTAAVSTVEKISKRDVVMGAVKQGCVGAFAGIAGCIFLIVLYLLASGKVLSARELNNHFDLQKIACVPGRKYSTLKGLDKLVASIDSSYYNNSKRAVCLQAADAGLNILFNRGAQVALVSDLDGEYLDKICAELNKAGTGRIRYFAVPCAEQTPEAISTIENCDTAVVVARAERSSYKGVADVLEIIRLLGREAAGSIVFM